MRGVRFQQAKAIRIESQVRLEVETDGELAGFTPASFEVLPQALQVIDWER
jgi:diacylglycerol kinase family enzyme